MVSSIYPWQQAQWEQLLTAKSQNKVPHALLLLGQSGLGKREFAIAWAQTLLCTHSMSPCHPCHSCCLMKAASHPDFRLLEPEQAGGMIKIDQVRELIQFTSETALQGHNRVVVIHPASAMNMHSANALLKTLEEPGPNTFFILVNDQQGRLPATIMSRCHKLVFNNPQAEVALAWLAKTMNAEKQDLFPLALQLANHSPLRAKEFLETDFLTMRQEFYNHLTLLHEGKTNPLQLAIHYQEKEARILFNLLFSWIQDLLRLQLTRGIVELTNEDYREVFSRLTTKIPTEKLLEYYDYVKQLYSHVLSNLNLNRQLLLETVFLHELFVTVIGKTK